MYGADSMDLLVETWTDDLRGEFTKGSGVIDLDRSEVRSERGMSIAATANDIKPVV